MSADGSTWRMTTRYGLTPRSMSMMILTGVGGHGRKLYGVGMVGVQEAL